MAEVGFANNREGAAMSITDELREYAQSWRETPNLMDELDAGDIDGILGDIEHIADRIDAEHEAKVAYWQGASYKDGYDEGFASADYWLAQHEDAMAEHGWVRLPVDADGVPIRVGDVMDGTCPSGKHVNGTVSAIGDGVFWLSNVQFSLKPDYMHHYHEPTVEDVLREFGDWYAHTKGGCDEDGIIAEYAAKLQLKEDA
jgi:hypothetical protein